MYFDMEQVLFLAAAFLASHPEWESHFSAGIPPDDTASSSTCTHAGFDVRLICRHCSTGLLPGQNPLHAMKQHQRFCPNWTAQGIPAVQTQERPPPQVGDDVFLGLASSPPIYQSPSNSTLPIPNFGRRESAGRSVKKSSLTTSPTARGWRS